MRGSGEKKNEKKNEIKEHLNPEQKKKRKPPLYGFFLALLLFHGLMDGRKEMRVYCDFPKGRRSIQSSKILENFLLLGLGNPDIISVEIGEKYHSLSGSSRRFL